jgi:hypothetical protein
MNKIKITLIHILIIEAVILSIVMTYSNFRLWKRYDEVTKELNILEERINNIAISNRLQYEDLLDIIER